MAKSKEIDPIFKELEKACTLHPISWYIYIRDDEFSFSRHLADKKLADFYHNGPKYTNTDFVFTIVKVDDNNYSIMDYSNITKLRGITTFEEHFKDKDELLAKIIHEPMLAVEEIADYCDLVEKELYRLYNIKINKRNAFAIDCLDLTIFDDIERYLTETCKFKFEKRTENNFDVDTIVNDDVGQLSHTYIFNDLADNSKLVIGYKENEGFAVISFFRGLELYVISSLQKKDVLEHAKKAINIMIEVIKGHTHK